MEDGADVAKLAHASRAIYVAPRFKSSPATQASADRMLVNIFKKLDQADPKAEERYRRASEFLKEVFKERQDGE